MTFYAADVHSGAFKKITNKRIRDRDIIKFQFPSHFNQTGLPANRPATE